MARREYSDETRAQVMAALLAGQSVSSAAREYKIPKGTLVHWRDAALSAAASAGVRADSTQKGDELGGLLLSYLRQNLITLRVQVEHFRDEKWLSRQGASELAVLHGVITDKAIRLLEALEGATTDEGRG